MGHDNALVVVNIVLNTFTILVLLFVIVKVKQNSKTHRTGDPVPTQDTSTRGKSDES